MMMNASHWISVSQEWAQPPTLKMVRADFLRVLAETGNAMAVHRLRVEDPNTQGPMPAGYDYLEMRESLIDGMGIFTARSIAKGEVVGPALVGGKRTPVGRYGNHSPLPNTAFKRLPSGDVEAIALSAIPRGSEISGNYRQGAFLCGERFDPIEVAKTIVLRLEQFRTVPESPDD